MIAALIIAMPILGIILDRIATSLHSNKMTVEQALMTGNTPGPEHGTPTRRRLNPNSLQSAVVWLDRAANCLVAGFYVLGNLALLGVIAWPHVG